MKNLIATHYKRTTPRGNGWTQLAFYTQDVDTKAYYLGFETFRPVDFENIQHELECNLIKPLDTPTAIDFDQTLWITPDYGIYLASFNNPQEDKKAVLLEEIDQVPIGQNPSLEEEISQKQLEKLKANYLPQTEKSYF